MAVAAHNAKLGRVLEGVGYPRSIVQQARAGRWSDFDTSLATPKMDLVEMLRTDGHEDLAKRVMDGEFDG